jgi:glucokinase
VASRTAISREIRKAIKRGYRSDVLKRVEDSESLSGKQLRVAYDSGDKLVRKVIHRSAEVIGLGIGSQLNLLGLEMVVLGGGVVEAFGDEFVGRVERVARDIAFDANSKDVKMVRAALGDDAGVIGVAMLAAEAIKHLGDHNTEQ